MYKENHGLSERYTNLPSIVTMLLTTSNATVILTNTHSLSLAFYTTILKTVTERDSFGNWCTPNSDVNGHGVTSLGRYFSKF